MSCCGNILEYVQPREEVLENRREAPVTVFSE
jgi:hypothetical protein